jgi:hypothetical protein
MIQPDPTAAPQRTDPHPEPERPPQAARADAAMSAYVGYLAGWFEIGRLAAGRRLSRAGLDAPLLNDS